MFWNSFIH